MNVDEYLSSTNPGASETDIEEVERATGYRFGPELRSLLIASNGGAGTRSKLVLPDRSTTAAFEYLPTREMATQWRQAELTPAHIPFVRDGNGNLLVADRDELVSFWDHNFATLMSLGFRIKDLPVRLQALPPDPPVDLRKFFPLAVPLMDAVESGEEPSRIIRQQQDVDVVSEFLLLAVSLDAPDLVRTIVAHVNDSLADRGVKVARALNIASRRSNIAVVEAFLSEDVSINAQDERGRTPLMSAAIACAGAMMDWLLARGADAHLTDAQGLTAKRLVDPMQCPELGDRLP